MYYDEIDKCEVFEESLKAIVFADQCKGCWPGLHECRDCLRKIASDVLELVGTEPEKG